MFARSILAITALIAVAPLAAQSGTKNDPAHQAADAREVPQTQSLNNQVSSAVTQAQTANAVAEAQNDLNQQQYEADKAAYEQALRDHHRDVLSTDATFIRQQNAYAMAMRDWRAQVAMCKKGYQSACNLPTPDPMKYM
ncbi:hypothetical protein [Rhizorhabdus dicambivorans]|uniref:Uncharacterized protein n=1 Tax=Rhizorhabdus dicambivorans TaxID=1850238 RepID=A0A2A4FX18_9SPHN|nr:hypothetical protein [Rhizorhabdus dicambivorans]ATE65373.1 hypothetical protein CMV14_13975 [Rhizorhabdus dicambivorans]PCE42297.1 hypothetical protein COO09_09805 [Rhizorhabdus dicambivorans]